MIYRSSLWQSEHWANFRNCEYQCAHTHTQTHLPGMTIVVVLSRVIPLSDFNVALGYNLSRPKQVLATHPRSHSPCTYTQTHTHKPCFFLGFSRCFAACICVTDTAYVLCVYVSCIQKCSSAVQRQVQREGHMTHTLTHKHNVAPAIGPKCKTYWLRE